MNIQHLERLRTDSLINSHLTSILHPSFIDPASVIDHISLTALMPRKKMPKRYLTQVASSNDDTRSGDLTRLPMSPIRRTFATLRSKMVATIRSSFAGLSRTNDRDPLTALSVRTKSKAYKSDSKTEAWTALETVFRGRPADNKRYSRYSWASTRPDDLASLLDARGTSEATAAAKSIREDQEHQRQYTLTSAVRSFMSFSGVDDNTITIIEQASLPTAQEQTNTVPVDTDASST